MFELNNIDIIRDDRHILTIDKLTVPTNGLTVILGHNGSGKSTLIQLLANQIKPDEGHVHLKQTPLTSFSKKEFAKAVAFLPQKLPEVAGLTVQELVKLGRFPWRGILGAWRNDDTIIVNEAMQATQVNQYADVLADSLSGGERQRAWVAMLLAQQAPILMLDEPTSALDIQHQYHLLELLQTLNQTQGHGVIVILHDINLALRYATHIIALKQGRIAFNGDIDLLNDEQTLSQLYQTDIRLIPHPHKPQQNVAIIN